MEFIPTGRHRCSGKSVGKIHLQFPEVVGVPWMGVVPPLYHFHHLLPLIGPLCWSLIIIVIYKLHSDSFLYRRPLYTNIAYVIRTGLYIVVTDCHLTNEMIDTSWVTNSDHDQGVLGRTMTSMAAKQFRFLSSGFM